MGSGTAGVDAGVGLDAAVGLAAAGVSAGGPAGSCGLAVAPASVAAGLVGVDRLVGLEEGSEVDVQAASSKFSVTSCKVLFMPPSIPEPDASRCGRILCA